MATTTHIEEIVVLCHNLDMESLENQISPSSQDQSLRLMRFSFEPNRELRKETEKLIQASDRPLPPFRFYASRQLYIQNSDYNSHEADLQSIGQRFSAFEKPLIVAPVLKSRRIDRNRTRFQLRLSEQELFDGLTSLEIKSDLPPDSRNEHCRPLPQYLPNVIKDQPGLGHYVFVDIATSSAVNSKERKVVERNFLKKAVAGKFSLDSLVFAMVEDKPSQ